ncbi:hypothetical protein FKM82_022017 [Ascaphus truei]
MIGKDRPRKSPPMCLNVLTPDRIPEFCIPPSLPSQRGMRASPCHGSVPNFCGSAFEVMAPRPLNTHVIQVETPKEESTNADPLSQAALSLPHLPKAQTSYGFCTLLESANTRRKESIFHNDPAAIPILLPISLSNTSSCRGTSTPGSVTTLGLHPRSRYGTLDSDTASSTDSSPFSSPRLHRSLPSSPLKALSLDKPFSRTLRVNCRSSSLWNNSVSTDESSSTDSSPCVTRRTSEDAWALPLPFTVDLVLTLGRFPRENTVRLDTGGVLRLSTEYRPENLRLRIRLISAEELYHWSVDPKNISCCVSLALVPGKKQKQRSTLIRRSSNPIFNEDFFFEGLAPQDLQQRTLKLKALNKGSGVKRDHVLGRSKLCLLSVLMV